MNITPFGYGIMNAVSSVTLYFQTETKNLKSHSGQQNLQHLQGESNTRVMEYLRSPLKFPCI